MVEIVEVVAVAAAEIAGAVVAATVEEVLPVVHLAAVVTVEEVALVEVPVEEEAVAEVVPESNVSGMKATVMLPMMKSQPRRETSKLETRKTSRSHPKEANPLKPPRIEDRSRTFQT